MVKLNKIKNLLIILSVKASFLQSADAFLMSENPSGSLLVGPLCAKTPSNDYTKDCKINLDEDQWRWMFEKVIDHLPDAYMLSEESLSCVNPGEKSLKIDGKVLILRTHFLLAGRIPKTHEAQPSEKACLVWFAMDNSGIYSAYCMRRGGATFKFAEVDGISKTSRPTFPIQRMPVRRDPRLRVLPHFVVLGLTGDSFPNEILTITTTVARPATIYIRKNPDFEPCVTCSNFGCLVRLLKERANIDRGLWFDSHRGKPSKFLINVNDEERKIIIEGGTKGVISLRHANKTGKEFRAVFYIAKIEGVEQFVVHALDPQECCWNLYGVFNSSLGSNCPQHLTVYGSQLPENLREYLGRTPEIRLFENRDDDQLELSER